MKKEKMLIRQLETRAAELHVRESDEGKPSRTIAGYAILFNTPSEPLWDDGDEEAREVIAPSAITREVLDASDIKFTMFHDRQLILARSNRGSGTLSYDVDGKGVSFEFDAPETADGDKALELVRRGDIAGCSFMFSTYYKDDEYVHRNVEVRDGKSHVTYTVQKVTGVYDFTLAADPAYPDTSVEARDLEELLRPAEESGEVIRRSSEEQVREMRRASKMIFV